MRLVARVVGHWAFALAAIVGVGGWFLVVPALTNQLGANPLEELLHRCGEIAIWLLGTVLALSPLRAIFPHSPIVAALNRHRRWIGVSAFIYGSLHLTCHVLYEGGWDGFRASWSACARTCRCRRRCPSCTGSTLNLKKLERRPHDAAPG